MNIRRAATILLPLGIAGAGATGLWWLLDGGVIDGPPTVFAAFGGCVFVVLGALAILKLTPQR